MSGAQVLYLADTSVVIGLARRDRKTMAAVNGKNFAVSFVSVAELYLGVLKAA